MPSGIGSKHVLVVACSRRKRTASGLMPAIERYDGPLFRVLRKARREGYWPLGLDVFILSAKYGLIDWSECIEPYELRMTEAISKQLRPQVLRTLASLRLEHVRELYIELGKDYLKALPVMPQVCPCANIRYGFGTIGRRLHDLKVWLHQSIPLDDPTPTL